MLQRHGDSYYIDCDSEPEVPKMYRNDFRVKAQKSCGAIGFNPSQLTIRRVRPRFYWVRAQYATGESMLRSTLGQRAITAHVHSFYMRHPELVPEEYRGLIIHSPGTLFEGYKSTLHVLGFYFVGGEIREDMFLVSGEITPTDWAEYQVIGIHPHMTPVRKNW